MIFKGASESDGQNNEQGSLYFCNLTEYLTKGHSNVRPSVKRWEMTGNPVKSRVVANLIEKK